MRHLAGLTRLRELHLDDSSITDAGLESLARMTQLRILSLRETDVTDAGLRHLTGMSELRELTLDMTRVTSAGLKHLAGLTQLQELRLSHTPVSNAGLVHLANLTQLKHLSLSSTRVTGAGLKHLAGLPYLGRAENLRWMAESNRKITKCLQRFGLVPSDADLPAIRKLVTDASQEAGEGDTSDYLIFLYCVQLFSRGHPDDAVRVWNAKQSSMDLSFAIDRELLCGGGVQPTMQYLATQAGEDAAHALQYLQIYVDENYFDGFSPEERLGYYRRYFGVQ